MTDAAEAHPATTAKHAPTYAHLFLAGLIALVGGAIVGSVAGNGGGRSEFSPRDLNEVEATLHWGSPTEVEIEFIWMSTAATRSGSDSIFGDNPGYHESDTLTLAKATIENVSQARIRIGELDLHLKAANGAGYDGTVRRCEDRCRRDPRSALSEVDSDTAGRFGSGVFGRTAIYGVPVAGGGTDDGQHR